MDFNLFDEPPSEYAGLNEELEGFDIDNNSVVLDNKHSPLFYSKITPFTPHSTSLSASLRKAPATTSVLRKMAATAAAVSPSSSPRLPSPPPFTEVQIGPQSPTVGDKGGNEQLFAPLVETDDGSTRRIRPGTKAADMASGPPLVPLSQLDSPFQLQEHLKALYHNYTTPNGSTTVQPITHEVAVALAHAPEGVERSLWLYELCRFLTMKVNNLIIAFFAEDPPCSQQSCPEMRASEWQYLCAVHDPPKSCCAIDYCCHTLDWATNILTSPKYFPSRLTLGSESGGGPQASMRHLTNIFRRLYRIFAHAWFQHRDVFRQVENTDGLYVFFKTVCDVYELIPQDNYTVPEEAERLVLADESSGDDSPIQPLTASLVPPENSRRISVLRKDKDEPANSQPLEEPSTPAPSNISTGATTRRHKHSPSTGSSVTTIAEANEDNNDTSAKNEIQLPKVEEKTEDAKPGFIVLAEDPEKQLVEQTENSAEEKALDKEEEGGEEEEEVKPETVEPTYEESHNSEEDKPDAAPEAATKEEESESLEGASEGASHSNGQISPAVTEAETVIGIDSTEEQQPPSEQQQPNGQSDTELESSTSTEEEPTAKTSTPAPTESTATVSVVETTEEKDD